MKDEDIFEVVMGGLALLVFCVLGFFVVRWGIHWTSSWNDPKPTTYCTEYVKAVKIQPTNSDNGKYSDEQYIVTYADGSITGQDQGNMDPYRCTHKTKTLTAKKHDWKTVNDYGQVDWSS